MLFEGYLLTGITIGFHPSLYRISSIILVDVFQLEGVHLLVMFGFVVDKDPEAHPDEAEGTNYDESHLPAPRLSNEWDGERCQ